LPGLAIPARPVSRPSRHHPAARQCQTPALGAGRPVPHAFRGFPRPVPVSGGEVFLLRPGCAAQVVSQKYSRVFYLSTRCPQRAGRLSARRAILCTARPHHIHRSPPVTGAPPPSASRANRRRQLSDSNVIPCSPGAMSSSRLAPMPVSGGARAGPGPAPSPARSAFPARREDRGMPPDGPETPG